MPKIAVQIEWDVPDDPYWLNADNIVLALHAYCKNTRFVVQEIAKQAIMVSLTKDRLVQVEEIGGNKAVFVDPFEDLGPFLLEVLGV